MSRRKIAGKRTILADPKYGSVLLAKFINVLMVDGKKSVAEDIVYRALERCQKQAKFTREQAEPIHVASNAELEVLLLETVLNKVRPTVEVRSRRVGGATYQIPIEVQIDRGLALAMRWLIHSARQRKAHGMIGCLADEMFDVLEGRGASTKKREETHKMAKANQAFAHFRWN